jgi:hypothetical protein
LTWGVILMNARRVGTLNQSSLRKDIIKDRSYSATEVWPQATGREHRENTSDQPFRLDAKLAENGVRDQSGETSAMVQ